MAFDRLWYGRKEHTEARQNEHIAKAGVVQDVMHQLYRSCLAGNFAAPHGALGYWVEFDTNGQYWWLYKGQTFDPWPKERGPMPEGVFRPRVDAETAAVGE